MKSAKLDLMPVTFGHIQWSARPAVRTPMYPLEDAARRRVQTLLAEAVELARGNFKANIDRIATMLDDATRQIEAFETVSAAMSFTRLRPIKAGRS